MKILEVVRSLRVQQWIKNFFVFAPLIFSQNVFNLPLLVKTMFAFVLFCILSGAAYILNDIQDLEEDKLHPVKSKRPLASGRLKTTHAFFACSLKGTAPQSPQGCSSSTSWPSSIPAS